MASGLGGECNDAGNVFGGFHCDEYDSMVSRTADLLQYVLDLNSCADGIEQRIQELMPHPLKSLQQLRTICRMKRSKFVCPISSEDLAAKFRALEELEKQASNRYPVLHGFLAKRHLIARHFLMAPALGAFAEKREENKQSWAFLEYSDPEERDWIARTLPRSCASTGSTAEVARLMDEVERMGCGLPGGDNLRSNNIQELKASGVCNEEWLGDDPLALVALEMIESDAVKKHEKRMQEKANGELCSAESGGESDETTEHLLKPFEKCHSLLFINVRLVALKLLNHYLRAGYLYPEHLQPAQFFQRKRQLRLVHSTLELSAKKMGVDAWGNHHVEDVLEEAAALLKSGQVCSCCFAGFKAIVECSGAYSLALAKVRLPELASGVLSNWKSPEFDKLWINIAEPPFPAPVLDEIERTGAAQAAFKARVLKGSRRDPGALNDIVAQYRKAKTYGLVKEKPEEYQHDDIVLKTSVQLLEKAEAQLHISPEKNDAGTEKISPKRRWWKTPRRFFHIPAVSRNPRARE